MNKQKIYVDMDGTLMKWNPEASLEEVTSKGYFRNLAAEANVCKAIRKIIATSEYEVFILSSVFVDDHSIEEKKQSLNYYLPEITEDHMIFVPYGESKSNFLNSRRKTDVLIDDFSENLHKWHGIAIKMYNGINGRHGTWTGYSVYNRMEPEYLAKQIIAIAASAA